MKDSNSIVDKRCASFAEIKAQAKRVVEKFDQGVFSPPPLTTICKKKFSIVKVVDDHEN